MLLLPGSIQLKKLQAWGLSHTLYKRSDYCEQPGSGLEWRERKELSDLTVFFLPFTLVYDIFGFPLMWVHDQHVNTG